MARDTDGQTDRLMNGEMDKQTNRWIDEQTDIQQQSLSQARTEPLKKLKVFLTFSKIVSYKFFSFFG